jgi:hypothetical protein
MARYRRSGWLPSACDEAYIEMPAEKMLPKVGPPALAAAFSHLLFAPSNSGFAAASHLFAASVRFFAICWSRNSIISSLFIDRWYIVWFSKVSPICLCLTELLDFEASWYSSEPPMLDLRYVMVPSFVGLSKVSSVKKSLTGSLSLIVDVYNLTMPDYLSPAVTALSDFFSLANMSRSRISLSTG